MMDCVEKVLLELDAVKTMTINKSLFQNIQFQENQINSLMIPFSRNKKNQIVSSNAKKAFYSIKLCKNYNED